MSEAILSAVAELEPVGALATRAILIREGPTAEVGADARSRVPPTRLEAAFEPDRGSGPLGPRLPNDAEAAAPSLSLGQIEPWLRSSFRGSGPDALRDPAGPGREPAGARPAQSKRKRAWPEPITVPSFLRAVTVQT